MKIVSVIIIKEWNPNLNGGAYFPLVPKVGDIIEVEKYDNNHYRWVSGYVDCVVPIECIKEYDIINFDLIDIEKDD